MARWAVFDVDGTLLPQTSAERLFLKELINRQIITPAQVLTFSLLLLPPFHSHWGEVLRANKGYFRGIPVANARRFSGWFFRHRLLPRLSPLGVAEVRRRKMEGYQIFLLSGAPQFLLEPLGLHLNADYILGCQLEQHNKRFTGRLNAPHPYGRYKRRYLLEVAPQLSLAFDQSVVFANHHTDALHMELFREAVAVNPTPSLAQIARERGWPVVHWHSKI